MVSMNPGARTSPLASKTCSPGIGATSPTATMRSPAMRKLPARRCPGAVDQARVDDPERWRGLGGRFRRPEEGGASEREKERNGLMRETHGAGDPTMPGRRAWRRAPWYVSVIAVVGGWQRSDRLDLVKTGPEYAIFFAALGVLDGHRRPCPSAWQGRPGLVLHRSRWSGPPGEACPSGERATSSAGVE